MKKLLLFICLLGALPIVGQNDVRQRPKVYIECSVDQFGEKNTSFAVQLGQKLREQGWIILKNKANAEYLLQIEGKAREYTRPVSKEKTTHTYVRVNDSIVTREDIVRGDRENAQCGAYGTSSAEMAHEQRVVTEVKDDIIDIEGSEPDGYMHFVYQDTHVTLSQADETVLYEDVLEVKEGHTLSYEEAARVAAKSTINQLVELLPKKIQ